MTRTHTLSTLGTVAIMSALSLGCGEELPTRAELTRPDDDLAFAGAAGAVAPAVDNLADSTGLDPLHGVHDSDDAFLGEPTEDELIAAERVRDDEGDQGDEGDELDPLSEKASYATYSIPYEYGVLRGLKPHSTHVCVLTKVQGQLNSRSEMARVYRSGDYWYLRGGSNTKATARCFPHSAFSTACIGGSTSAGGSSCLNYYGRDVAATGFMLSANDPQYQGKSMDNGYSAAILNGVSGYLNRVSNGGVVSQSLSRSSVSGVWSYFQGSSSPIGAYGFSYAPGKQSSYVRVSGNYSLHRTKQSSTRVSLNATTDTHMCFLTGVRGDFNSNSDYARLSIYSGKWYLYVAAGTGDVLASARCMFFKQ